MCVTTLVEKIYEKIYDCVYSGWGLIAAVFKKVRERNVHGKGMEQGAF